ncbi:MAG: FAD-dependent 5-carboxymethylaminomethyl-2-thiouridine(34) oxidoreductase MnmC [Hyphomonas sp.]|nr:FAD-dependent 5-carboxymethylaminomethyl-2-thiouridine(34) oxidoreductase MnmC [Hyphomonas sp.]
MRLPPRPDLSWKEDGTPVDDRVGDVYYSIEDGLAESRAVFLHGCGLPDAWKDRSSFTIAELGFGTGLNFLAAWQMWRDQRPSGAWLNFVSFEGFPLDREDAARALTPWPELAELTKRLCARWPIRAKGIQQITWPEERLTLTLHIGLIEETLPQSEFEADAWFLDGFSPAKNEAMWANSVWPDLAARTKPGARVATFTVAGSVRRGLAEAGFEVEKKPGHGRKRERLEARAPALLAPALVPSSPNIAIIGAGISGACLARRLIERGARVTVFDQAEGPALGTSGNPLALMMPRLDAADTAQARLLIDAYVSAQAFYRDRPGVAATETRHYPRDETEATRFQKLLADPPLGLEQLEAIRDGGLLHKHSMILDPSVLLPSLLQGVDVRWCETAEVDVSNRAVNGEEYDAIILATGWHMARFAEHLDLTGRLGQVESYTSEIEAPPSALASGHYALAAGTLRLWGATFADHDGRIPKVDPGARIENLEALDSLSPYWRTEAQNAEIKSRAGVRATTADRLPLIGALPDSERLIADRQTLERQAWSITPNDYATDGIYVAGGYGSRGFTWAPWAAGILTAQLFHDPIPARREALHATVPNRQILRKLKRKLL